jgi:UDP-N-acetylglucosamine--N-acetylmuramyl-(pentapeptide) pyrophosphoryl-undecaprenol N-acetylglucosamine transferase
LVVPYPYSGAHQRQNALYLVEEGAAIMLEDAEVRERLGPEVSRLLGDERTLLNMAERSLSLARPEAAHALAELVVSTSRKRASRVMPTLAHEDRVV